MLDGNTLRWFHCPMPNTFKAVTWNVFHGTERSVIEPILTKQLAHEVSILLVQEASRGFWPSLLAKHGLEFAFHEPQYLIAWNPSLWVGIDQGGVRLSDERYFRKDGSTPQYSEAVWAILCDRQGRSLDVVSYHTPAHVQVPERDRPERRYAAMVESFINLGHRADDADTTGVLYGGDDNWDENTGISTPDVRPYLLGEATGLRQVASPVGTTTHGRRRQIDDFRIKRGGALAVGSGWVFDGGGDHKGHGRTFRWR